jgi:hypothetical protein
LKKLSTTLADKSPSRGGLSTTEISDEIEFKLNAELHGEISGTGTIGQYGAE